MLNFLLAFISFMFGTILQWDIYLIIRPREWDKIETDFQLIEIFNKWFEAIWNVTTLF